MSRLGSGRGVSASCGLGIGWALVSLFCSWFFSLRTGHHWGELTASHFDRCRYDFQLYMLRAIDQSALSIDRAAPSRDLLLAQASIDGATINGSRCAIDG